MMHEHVALTQPRTRAFGNIGTCFVNQHKAAGSGRVQRAGKSLALIDPGSCTGCGNKQEKIGLPYALARPLGGRWVCNVKDKFRIDLKGVQPYGNFGIVERRAWKPLLECALRKK